MFRYRNGFSPYHVKVKTGCEMVKPGTKINPRVVDQACGIESPRSRGRA
jgi:hypothetical protein